MSALYTLKVAALSCIALAIAIACGSLLVRRDSVLHRLYFRYLSSLERRMRLMFIDTPALLILIGQVVTMVGAIAGSISLKMPLLVLLVPLAAVAPGVLLEHKRKQRVATIELKLEGFVLALANALRASPSAGRALAMVQPVTAAPLDREIELVLREMRVGSTLEQALANLSARVRSFQLDAAMSCLLIGRQTGGNVPLILDGAAHTLREITRLQGVLRTKTAEGRAQANVLAVFPLVLVFLFDWAKPGYFTPLTDSALGYLITLAAIAMWISSVILTRRIMAVQL